MANQKGKKTKGALSVAELTKRLDARSAKRRKDEEDEAKILIVTGGECDGDGEREDIDIPGGEEGAEAIADVVEAIDDKLEEILSHRKNRDEEGTPETLEDALAHIIQLDEDVDALLGIIEEQKAKSDFTSTVEGGENADDDENDDDDDDIEGGEPETHENHINADGRGKRKVKSAPSIDKIVQERIKLLRIGDRLNLDGLDDMSPRQMKVAIVKAVNPKMRLDGKGNHYIDAAFDIAVETMATMKSTDRQRKSMGQRMDGESRRQTGATLADTAREKMNNRLMNGGDE